MAIKNLSTSYEHTQVPLFVRKDSFIIQRQLKVMARTVSLKQHFSDEIILRPPISKIEDVDGYFIEFCPSTSVRKRISFKDGFLCYNPYLYDRFFIDFSVSFESYTKSLSSQKRQQIQRKIRHYERQTGHCLTWEVYDTAVGIQEFFKIVQEILLQQASKNYPTLPHHTAFIEEAMLAAERQELRTYILFAEGKATSYLFCPVVDGALVYEYLGYDQAYAALSPGFLLLWKVIQDAFKHRTYSYLDFTRGSGQQKRYFANGRLECGDIFFLRKTAKNILSVLLHYPLNKSIYYWQTKF